MDVEEHITNLQVARDEAYIEVERLKRHVEVLCADLQALARIVSILVNRYERVLPVDPNEMRRLAGYSEAYTP